MRAQRASRPPLGPWCVGQRVVIRRELPGQAGPSGGPALTDVLGVLESWGSDTLTVRAADGVLVEMPRSDVVAGKVVPPRSSPRQQVSVRDAEHRALGSWPPVEAAPLGDWVLRAAGGFSARANSALLVGDPQRPWDGAVRSVRAFYVDRGLPAWVQAMAGSVEHERLLTEGWVTARPGEADTAFLLGGVGRAVRLVRPLTRSGAAAGPVALTERATAGWLANDDRARHHGADALRVLEGPDEVCFATIVTDDDTPTAQVLAKGRAAVTRSAQDPSDAWLGITDVWVSPAHRRRGLAATVLLALLEWGAEAGASSTYLQVREDNPAALALYERLGYRVHHSYAYLRPDR